MNPIDSGQHVYTRSIRDGEMSSLSLIASRISTGTSVLDVGTGTGALGRFLSEKLSCEVDGITNNPQEAQVAKPFYRNLVLGDLEICSPSSLFPHAQYDYVVLADVLEHLRHPETVVAGALALLRPTGRLLVSLPNVGYAGLIAELLEGDFRYRQEGLLDETHLRFFSRNSLQEFFTQCGCNVVSIESVYRELSESEFDVTPSQLPPSVFKYVSELPDALTYQFILDVVPKGSGNEKGSTTLSPRRPGFAVYHSVALYWRPIDSAYDELHKLILRGKVGEDRQELVFQLPSSTTIGELRLDPADRPGYVRLWSMILRLSSGEILWEWDRTHATLGAAQTQQMTFAASPPEQGVVALMHESDPFVILPIPQHVLKGITTGATLAVTLGWPMSSDYIALNMRVSDESRRVSEVGAAIETLQQDLDAERELSALYNARLEEMHRFLLDHTDKMAALEIEQESLYEILKQKRLELEQVQDDREKLLKHLRSIEDSTVFRMTRPIVRLKMKLDGWRQVLRPSATTVAPSLPRANTPFTKASAVDIVIPVYRGLTDTQRCVESVLSSRIVIAHRLVIIDDATPEPEVASYLRHIADANENVVLLVNKENLGFVASVNRGMSQNPEHDLVLLNSDTEVALNWLDRLYEAAYHDIDIGTVTPLSNNATICSYPRFCEPNELPAGYSTEALDTVCSKVNAGRHVDIPTAVGFCMYIRRDCLNQVGPFDVREFGTGYGEENDFCMRASYVGWRHVLALDTFVRHVGGVSFGAAKRQREIDAFEKLRRLHTTYESSVRTHVAEDPARPARLAIDIARMKGSQRIPILFVTHDRGGGTERHVRELASVVADKAVPLVLRPAGNQSVSIKWLPQDEEAFEVKFRLPDQLEDLIRFLVTLGVGHIHFHHLLGIAPAVWSLPERMGVSYDFTVHDYYAICPQITLTGVDSRYCGETGSLQCRACLRQNPAPGDVDILEWRHNYLKLLRGARHVFVPSQDVALRFAEIYPGLQTTCVAHTDLKGVALPEPHCRTDWNPPERTLKVGIIGALSSIKGADVLESVAIAAANAQAPVEFHLIGYAYRSLVTQPKAHLTVHGAYEEQDLVSLVDWLDLDVIWFPALWPETYSYTLSACLRLGLPVVAPDIGAFQERLTGRNWTWIEPWNQTELQWLAFFNRIRTENFSRLEAPRVMSNVTSVNNVPGFAYEASYMDGLSMHSSAHNDVDFDLLSIHAFSQATGTARVRFTVRQFMLSLLVNLRNRPLLRTFAKRIPLRLQTRVKTWLSS